MHAIVGFAAKKKKKNFKPESTKVQWTAHYWLKLSAIFHAIFTVCMCLERILRNQPKSVVLLKQFDFEFKTEQNKKIAFTTFWALLVFENALIISARSIRNANGIYRLLSTDRIIGLWASESRCSYEKKKVSLPLILSHAHSVHISIL